MRVEIEHVDGTFNAKSRGRLLQWLKDDAGEGVCRVLTNARCLSEGVRGIEVRGGVLDPDDLGKLPLVAGRVVAEDGDGTIMLYTHLSDRYAPFHVKVIAATASEAEHVLDGLLYTRLGTAIVAHAADGGAVSDHAFGLCALLGYRFTPRSRGWTTAGSTRSSHAWLTELWRR